jgi:hypothetical protein
MMELKERAWRQATLSIRKPNITCLLEIAEVAKSAIVSSGLRVGSRILTATMFGDERRRAINLGGESSTVTQASVRARVQEERQRRQNEKRQNEASSLIQAAWRAHLTRKELLQSFDREPVGTIASTRFLVLGGGEHTRLMAWTKAALKGDKSQIFAPFAGPDANTWLVLLRQLTAIMLTQIVSSPQCVVLSTAVMADIL